MTEEFYKLCTSHDNQFLMFIQTKFPQDQSLESSNKLTKYPTQCSYCIFSSRQNIKNYTNYDNFSQIISSKYYEIEKIKQLLIQLQKDLTLSPKKEVNQIQEKIISLIQQNLITEFEQSKEEYQSMNRYQTQYSQKFLELYRLKTQIEFEESLFYELSKEAQQLLNSFKSLIVYKSSTKPFKVSEDNKIKLKTVAFDTSNAYQDQTIKSNLMKFKENIFVFGDNYGYLYFYNCKTQQTLIKKTHNNQICVIEKIKEDFFCSGALDNKIVMYKLDSQDQLIVLGRIQLQYQVFRLKKIDNKRIACNQGSDVFIINISKEKAFIEKKLIFRGQHDVFGILYMNQQIIALHGDGRLNFWNWKKGIIIRSYKLQDYLNNPIYETISNINHQDQTGQMTSQQMLQFLYQQSLQDQQQSYEESNMEQEDEEVDDEEEEVEEGDGNDEDWETNSQESQIIQEYSYSRIRQLSDNHIAVVTQNNIIQVHDFRDFYFQEKLLKIKINYEILCLERIPNTDCILVAGNNLEIYNLKTKLREILIENNSLFSEDDDNTGYDLGEEGLIGGAIFNQNQIASVKLEEKELLFIQL